MRQASLLSTALLASLVMKAAALAQAQPRYTYHAVRQDWIHLAADLDQYACKPHEVDTKICVNTTEADCTGHYPGRQWYPGYTCDDLTWGACRFYSQDGVTQQCQNTTKIACKKLHMSHFYQDESCGD
jgi:hypothetical protein